MLEGMHKGDGFEFNRKGNPTAQTKYLERIDLRGFEPSDVKVRVQGQNVIVEARREVSEEQDGMYSRSLREVRRTLNLPENVDKENIKSALTTEGILEIDAPLLKPIESQQSEKEKVSIDIEMGDGEQESTERKEVVDE